MIYQEIITQLGVWQAVWSEHGLYALEFPQEKPIATSKSSKLTKAQKSLKDQLVTYSNGQKVDFAEVVIDFADYTAFEVNILKHCRDVKYGQIITYKKLSEMASAPRAYRAVGRSLGKNRTPIVIPCHRIIGSNQKLVGFAGGLDLKKTLIELEGGQILD